MLMKDPKKSLAIIIASKGRHPEEAPKSENGAEDDSSIGKHSAAEEIVNAIHSKDHKALAASLEAFMSMCHDDSEEPSTETEGVSPDEKKPDNASGYIASREK